MTFTDADSCKLYRLNTKIENNTASILEMCTVVKLRTKKLAVFKRTGERR